jgi:hypothetical protein
MIDQLDPKFVAAYAEWLGVTDGEAYRLLEQEPLEDVTDEVVAAAWNEEDHPRHPEGTSEGGQFAPKVIGISLSPEHRELLRGYREGLRRASGFLGSDQTYLSGHFMNKILRENLSDAQAADYMIRTVYQVGQSKESAPVYQEKLGPVREQLRVTRANIERLDELIDSSTLKEDYVVYRGMTNPGSIFGYAGTKQFEENLDKLVGRSFTDRGFTATTWDEEVARKGFAKAWYNDGWVMRIPLKEGTPALMIDEGRTGVKSGLQGFDSEREILLGRGHKFRITSIDRETRTIDLEMLK